MKRSLKATAAICAGIMALTAMTAMSSAETTAADQPAASVGTESRAPKAKNVKFGKVTAVNGNEITVALGDMGSKLGKKASDSTESSTADENVKKSKTKPSSKPGKKSSDSAESSTADENVKKSKTKPSSKPEKKPSDSAESSTADNTAADSSTADKKPAGKRGGKHKGKTAGEFTESGSTLTVTATDSITLKKNGKTVSASDIAVGDVLTLEYNDNNELVGIKVMKAPTEKTKHEKGTKTKDETAA